MQCLRFRKHLSVVEIENAIMKKIFSVLLILMMCINLVSPMEAMASNEMIVCPAEVCTAVINELSLHEYDKYSLGIEDVNFKNLYISKKISVYEYTQDSFSEISNLYLLFENNEIVTAMYGLGNNQYQIMTKLANDIKQVQSTNIAVIYDINGCYLYNGSDFVLLGITDIIVENRENITRVKDSEISELSVVNISETQKLNYESNNINARSQANYMCSVKYVTQTPNDSICWAATTACIVNYVKGKNLTAKQVATAKWGTSDYNKGLEVSKVISFMNSKYNMNYKYHNYVPSDNVILNNIQDDYPIYGSFDWSNGRHGVTVYGINVIAGRIMIMDPEFGSTTAYLGANGYTYVNSYAGVTLTFKRAGCKTW